jgi:hypothetical protein
MFAILQQLNMIPNSRLLPSLRSFIPFASASPLQLPSYKDTSLPNWGLALLRTATPMLIILLHGRIKFFIAKLVYRPIYKTLPRPTGESMFSGLDVKAPELEYDAPDRISSTRRRSGEDAQTLRALEGRPAMERRSTLEVREEREEERMRLLSISIEQQDIPSDDDEERHQAPLISFDVEATDSVPDAMGSWSAELRSANDMQPSGDVRYHITGLTLLPTISATEGLREIVASILVLPLETLMVRIIARAYRQSAGAVVSDLYEVSSFRALLPASSNLLGAFTLQIAVTGVVWAGFTFGTQWYTASRAKYTETPGSQAAP